MKPCSILIVEDHPFQQILRDQLEELGCSVELASNGEEALSMWNPERFDLVLTDVNMPVMNGYELAKAQEEWQRRLDACPEEHRPYLVLQYATPVRNQYRVKAGLALP
nr:response regulator [Pseudomonas chlororaphis]